MKLATGDAVLPEIDLSAHSCIFGATGSGKTGLTIAIIEEALLSGVHVLAIDTKGDLSNIALVFDDFNPHDFEPWTSRVSEDNSQVLAAEWKRAIVQEGNGDRIRPLAGISRTIYTPGSSSGIPLNVLSSLTAPSSEYIELEIDCTLNSLFELIDEPVDLASPGYVVCGQILAHHWTQNRPIDLEGLVVSLIDPPFMKVGQIAVDQYMGAADRRKLAMKLSLLLASSAFQSLSAGRGFEPGDFFGENTEPSCAVVSIGHLSEPQRQFVVSRLLAELTTWMHGIGGSPDTRLLVVIDEVGEYCPATAKPPAKDEILELVKKGRAFGVGVTTTAHNPFDVDHRLMANSATWFSGRLGNDRDLDRFLEVGTAERGELRDEIMGLEQREFAIINSDAGAVDTTTFTCRQTMSFLAGPLARPQIRELTDRLEEESLSSLHDGSARPVVDAPDDNKIATSDLLPDLPQRWSVGDWVAEFGGDASSSGRVPALVVTADLRWDRDIIDLDMVEERHEINFPIGSDRWWTERSLGGLLILMPPDQPTADETALDDELISQQITRARTRYDAIRTRELAYAPGLRLWAKPGESIADFRGRCRTEAFRAARAEVLELDSHIERQKDGAIDRLANLSESQDADVDELRLHLAGVVAELRNASEDSQALADEIEADWLAMSKRIEMQTLTIDPDADIEMIPWILWIPQ